MGKTLKQFLAEAKTEEELRDVAQKLGYIIENTREALAFYIEKNIEDGLSISNRALDGGRMALKAVQVIDTLYG